MLRNEAKTRPPWTFPSIILLLYRPSSKNLRDNFLTKWPKMSKICDLNFYILGHLFKKLSLRFLEDGQVTKLLRGMCQGSLIFQHYYKVTLMYIYNNSDIVSVYMIWLLISGFYLSKIKIRVLKNWLLSPTDNGVEFTWKTRLVFLNVFMMHFQKHC